KLDLEVQTAIRLGAYQILFLDRIPTHAAINESVELVKQARKTSAAGLVNAILRRNASHSSQGTLERMRQSSLTDSSHPEWMVERWRQFYGKEVTRKICEYDQAAPRTAVRIENPDTPQTAGHAARSQPRAA